MSISQIEAIGHSEHLQAQTLHIHVYATFLSWSMNFLQDTGTELFQPAQTHSVRKPSLEAKSLTSVHYFNYKPKTGCRWLYWNSSSIVLEDSWAQYCLIPHSESLERELLGTGICMHFPLWGLYLYTIPELRIPIYKWALIA